MSQARIHSLDGLRALAISLVLLAHLHSSHTFGVLDVLWRFESLGDMGVRIFFVLSGFIITTLLRREHLATGRIGLTTFYVKRCLRIWPAYAVLLAVLGLAAVHGVQAVNGRDLLAAAAFVANYIAVPRVLGHAWSLAVEEQFYLLWPLCILVLGWRRAAFVALGFCLLAPALRGFALRDPFAIKLVFWTRFEHAGDAIAWGCVYALAAERGLLWRPRQGIAALLAVGSVLGLLLLSTTGRWALAWSVVGVTFANLLAVALLHGALHARETVVGAVLNAPVSRALGVLSYSLYLWQQVFVYGGFKLPAPYNLLAIFGVASLSYFVVEKPFLILKDRMSRPPAPLAATAS
ncbi:acyltransferase [Niveibacterium sp. SC-1]|uniref:acyltransferase family protein n=1 Tax=Niveibacterium sp. SC-1 TaxID=3135646 RepID=UPI00311F9177